MLPNLERYKKDLESLIAKGESLFGNWGKIFR